MNNICPNCNSNLTNDANFCGKCGYQIKCKECKSIRIVDDRFCGNCGTTFIASDKVESSRAVNELQYNQKGDSKSFVAKFTDEVGAYFATSFNAVVTGQPLQKNLFQKQLLNHSNNAPQTPSTKASSPRNDIQDVEIVSEIDEAEILQKIFKQNDEGNLELIDNRVKEKSKFDKTKRLAVLYVYTNSLRGINVVTRKDLNNFISQQKLSLGDLRKILSKDGSSLFSFKDNGDMSILGGGKDYAVKILSEVGDDSYQPTKTKSGRRSGKKNSSNSKAAPEEITPSNTKSKSSSPSATNMVKQLIGENYFSTKRKVGELIEYCKTKKAVTYTLESLSMVLKRLVASQSLERDKSEDGQYEYWKK